MRPDHGDQSAQGEVALNDQITADRVEEERGELGEKIVQELDEELFLVDGEPDIENDAQLLAEAGAFILRGVVGADVAHALGGFADALGQATHLAHPGLGQLVHLALQLRDDPDLKRVEHDRGEAQNGILREHEDQDGQERAALERRQGEGLGDEAAERFHLGGDHLHQLALGDPPKMRQRKAHDARIELVAKPPQHALADHALVDVDDVFEGAIDQDENEKDAAKREQVVDLIQLDAEDRSPCAVGHGVVDDDLRQIEAGVEKRERDDGQREDGELLRFAVAQDVAENTSIHQPSRMMRPDVRTDHRRTKITFLAGLDHFSPDLHYLLYQRSEPRWKRACGEG